MYTPEHDSPPHQRRFQALNCRCPNCETPLRALPKAYTDPRTELLECATCGCCMLTHNPVWWDEEEENPFPEPFIRRGWQPLGVLGRGGMGVVYTATRDDGSPLRAIKVLPPECSKYPELVERFSFEIRTMASVSHPNIVGIHDFDEIDRQLYFVMNYIPGDNLKNVLKQQGRLSLEEAVTIARHIAEAIEFCHLQKLVHRDLKPANVMLHQNGDVLVTDFGIANIISALGDKTDAGVAIGTPQYVAPEQLKDGSDVDFRADQYSLAVILFEMITGNLPMGVFSPPREDCPELTEEAEKVLLKALSRDREKRFTSVRGFIRQFSIAQGISINSHRGKILVRRLALYNSPKGGNKTPFSTEPQRDLDLLSHPSREVPNTLDSEQLLEQLMEGGAPSPLRKPKDETPSFRDRLQPYKNEETPLSPWWRRK
ncbi:MAG: serine/threonine-protein kinase [Candidatus Sumerlaeia bacterium]|nr:serine/threonine-protein kinase [Candidatus Sumerlaeia bacterium]